MKPIGPYSPSRKAGGFVFVSGQIAAEAQGVAAQTEGSLKQLAAVLSEHGLTLADVVKTTVFMTDLGRFAEMNDVYAKHFAEPYPARATVQVSALPKGVSVEIEAVAVTRPVEP